MQKWYFLFDGGRTNIINKEFEGLHQFVTDGIKANIEAKI